MSEIKVKIIADSKSSVDGKRITTFELEYHRYIHGELMTHRMFSRNAASSRAIPVAKMIEMVDSSPATPIHWGKNQAGMQAKEELDSQQKNYAIHEWQQAAYDAVGWADILNKRGVHKQVVNRILEPFQMMKTVLTATEFDNFFWLRNHEDAQPEIKRLAELMLEAMNSSEPVLLQHGDWHMPYFGGEDAGYWLQGCGIPLEDALAISSSCCAQVSYRKLDDSLEKAKDIFSKLIESKPCHASPTEHQATPMKYPKTDGFCADDTAEGLWQEGVTHMDKSYNFWSGNFKGFVQHRQLIPDNVCNIYKENV